MRNTRGDLLKAGFVYQNELFPTVAGTPQGGIISPVAANMTLDGLEAMLAEKFPHARRAGLKMNMVRYADDFIITGNSKEWLEQEVKPAVVEFLAVRRNYVATAQTSHPAHTYNLTCSNLQQVHHGYLSRHLRSCDQTQ